MTNLINLPKKIILHCSDTPDEGNRWGLKDLKEWHINYRNFSDVGYHYVIKRDGLVEIGRPETTVGAHCLGHNEGSIGVCYIGTKHMTEMQIDSLMFLFKAIYARHKIPATEVYGHYEFNNSKSCPGQDMAVIRKLLGTVKLW